MEGDAPSGGKGLAESERVPVRQLWSCSPPAGLLLLAPSPDPFPPLSDSRSRKVAVMGTDSHDQVPGVFALEPELNNRCL